ncbi:MAG: diguanylate cyclase [Rhodanobacteraceae bacterium]|nr:diguanylate cyclase [Rhodanobacteraceae bacterium]
MNAASDSETRIEALLADPAYAEHPMREPLAQLYRQFQEQVRQLDRITRISDRYQNAAQREASSLTERLNKHLKQVEKIARISDRYQAMLQDLNKRLEHESTHDALTGLANRRLGLARLSELIAADQPLSIALVDVDHFKRVNDAFGHEAGDQALTAVAHALRDPLGGTELVARWGGEEFLLIWPQTDLAAAIEHAQALRLAVPAQAPTLAGRTLRTTVSLGLAQRRDGESVSQLLRRADAALYAAKDAGRDRVMAAQ